MCRFGDHERIPALWAVTSESSSSLLSGFLAFCSVSTAPAANKPSSRSGPSAASILGSDRIPLPVPEALSDGRFHRVVPCFRPWRGLLSLGTHVTTRGRATGRGNHNYVMCWCFSAGLPLAVIRGGARDGCGWPMVTCAVPSVPGQQERGDATRDRTLELDPASHASRPRRVAPWGLCVDHRARRYPSRPERPGDGLAPGRLFPPGHMALVCSPRQARCEQGRPVNCGSGPGR
jgi:hypothetical protein